MVITYTGDLSGYVGTCRDAEGLCRLIHGIVGNQLEKSMIGMETGMTQ